MKSGEWRVEDEVTAVFPPFIFHFKLFILHFTFAADGGNIWLGFRRIVPTKGLQDEKF